MKYLSSLKSINNICSGFAKQSEVTFNHNFKIIGKTVSDFKIKTLKKISIAMEKKRGIWLSNKKW